MPIKSKKVLFTSHVANFQKFNRPFMRWFKEQGYEVHYASMGEEEVFDCDKHFKVPFERSPFKMNNLKAAKRLKKIIDREEYDIIHTHTPMGGVITRIAAIAARKRGTRVIYTAHGFHFFKGAPVMNWLIYYPVEKLLARFTDMLIAINKEDYNRAKKHFKTDVQYVPGVGVDPKKFNVKMTDSDRLKLRKSLGLNADDFVMIYSAEISKRKNQEWLIRSVAGLMKNRKNIHLLLPGKDSMDGRCQSLVKQLGVEYNVHFLGYRNDISELMRISDLAVSSSTQEGLPVNIMEAMYTGLPVVATDCRGNRDLVIEGKNGFICLHDEADKFQDYVDGFYDNSKLRRSFGSRGRSFIEEYSLLYVLKSMTSIYLKKKDGAS